MRQSLMTLSAALLLAVPALVRAQNVEPLVIGETFTIHSEVLGEERRINVYRPPSWDSVQPPLPVLYMPDGGIGEDFLHIAGLVQISSLNGTMRPVILVGIENTERRRDLTGPTSVASDREIAPRVGGSAKFREFVRTELMPLIEARYATTGEKGIIGESLAGLFVLETLVLEPDLFDIHIAFDPSLWWNGGDLLRRVPEGGARMNGRVVYIASSSEPKIASDAARFAELLKAVAGVTSHYEPMPDETHGTIYHPAALEAVRRVYAPAK